MQVVWKADFQMQRFMRWMREPYCLIESDSVIEHHMYRFTSGFRWAYAGSHPAFPAAPGYNEGQRGHRKVASAIHGQTTLYALPAFSLLSG